MLDPNNFEQYDNQCHSNSSLSFCFYVFHTVTQPFLNTYTTQFTHHIGRKVFSIIRYLISIHIWLSKQIYLKYNHFKGIRIAFTLYEPLEYASIRNQTLILWVRTHRTNWIWCLKQYEIKKRNVNPFHWNGRFRAFSNRLSMFGNRSRASSLSLLL